MLWALGFGVLLFLSAVVILRIAGWHWCLSRIVWPRTHTALGVGFTINSRHVGVSVYTGGSANLVGLSRS